jgi:hypothetical protein
MRNSKTHSKTLKRRLSKCQTVFYAYNDIQYAYGIRLDSNQDVVDIKCNVKLVGCPEGEYYTTDFYCTKINGEIMVRECVDKEKLLKPLTAKMLDISRNYWLSKGVVDWGIVLNESK